MITDGNDQNRLTTPTVNAQYADIYFKYSCAIVSFFWDIYADGTYTLSIDGVNYSTVVVTGAPVADVEFVLDYPYRPVPQIATRVTMTKAGAAAKFYDYDAAAYSCDSWRVAGVYYDGSWFNLITIAFKIEFDETDRPVSSGQDYDRSTAGSFSSQSASVVPDISGWLHKVWWWIKNTGTYTLSIDGSDLATVVVGAAGRIEFVLSSPFELTDASAFTLKLTRDTGAATWWDNNLNAFSGLFWDETGITYNSTYYSDYTLPVVLLIAETETLPVNILLNRGLIGGFYPSLRGGL